MKSPLFATFCLLAFTAFVNASHISENEAVNRATDWMASNPIMKQKRFEVDSVETFPETGYQVYILRLAPSGYLVVNSDDALDLVVCYSPDSDLDLSDVSDNAFRGILLSNMNQSQERLSSGKSSVAVKTTQKGSGTVQAIKKSSAELKEGVVYGPYLEVLWDQHYPYNKFCPENPAAGEYYQYRCSTGCTITAVAQVMSYHRWPIHGTGEHSYVDNQGSFTGTHSAVFSDEYDWANMKDNYQYRLDHPTESEDAIAELMYELGVAGHVDYGVSGGAGTGGWVPDIRENMGNFMYYEPYEDRHSHFEYEEILKALNSDLNEGLPCVVANLTHAFVADGVIREYSQTTYHFNLGWDGKNNGWWPANNVLDGNLTFALSSILPQLMAFPERDEVSALSNKPIELRWILPKRRYNEAAKITILEEDESTGTWTPIATDTELRCRMFSSVETSWDDANDFSVFEVTSTNTYKDWAISNDPEQGNCFYKAPTGYSNQRYHLTSNETITPTENTRLWMACKYLLATDEFKVMASTDKVNYTEVWANEGTAMREWGTVSIDLGQYAGTPIYIRIEYLMGVSHYSEGGIWISSIKTEEVSNPDYEGQPVHYTTLSGLAVGEHTLATVVTDKDGVEHARSPSFKLSIPPFGTAPVLGAIGNKSVDEGSELSFTATAYDAEYPTQPITFSLQGAPNGATIDPSTGAFKWTPTEEQGPGSYTFQVEVSDGELTDSTQITVTVNEANQAPTIGFISDRIVDASTELSFRAEASDSDLPTQALSFSLKDAPTGASINSATGTFTWTPTVAQADASYTFSIEVSDGTLSDSQEILVLVNGPQAINPTYAYWISDKNGTDNLFRGFWGNGIVHHEEQVSYFTAPQRLVEYRFDETNRRLGLIVAENDTHESQYFYTADLDGENLHQVSSCSIGAQFDFAPGGNQIIFGQADTNPDLSEQEVCIMNIDDASLILLLGKNEPQGVDSHKTAFTWLDDGSILFSVTALESNSHKTYLWQNGEVVSLNGNPTSGTRFAYLSPDESRLLVQTLSTDGTSISYIGWPANDAVIAVIAPTTSEATPSGWLDNDTFAYGKDGDIFFYNIEKEESTNWTNSSSLNESQFRLLDYSGVAAITWLCDALPDDTPYELRTLEADADKDGIANIMEYAQGSNPGIPGAESILSVNSDPESGSMSFSIQCHADEPRLAYAVEISSDLSSWEKVDLALDADTSTWSTSSAAVALLSASKSDTGLWELQFSLSDASVPMFIRMLVSLD